MRIKALGLAAFFFAAATAAAGPNQIKPDQLKPSPNKAESLLIVPGKGVGPFHAGMTRGEVQKLVKPEELGDGESDAAPALSVYFMDPARRIALRLDKAGKVRGMVLHGENSVWHDSHGITLGTALGALEKLNGKPLRLRAFDGSVQAGQVLDWSGGALAKELARVRLTFASPMHAAGYAKLTSEQKVELEKARDFLSSDAAIQQLNPVLETIELTF